MCSGRPIKLPTNNYFPWICSNPPQNFPIRSVSKLLKWFCVCFLFQFLPVGRRRYFVPRQAFNRTINRIRPNERSRVRQKSNTIRQHLKVLGWLNMQFLALKLVTRWFFREFFTTEERESNFNAKKLRMESFGSLNSPTGIKIRFRSAGSILWIEKWRIYSLLLSKLIFGCSCCY